LSLWLSGQGVGFWMQAGTLQGHIATGLHRRSREREFFIDNLLVRIRFIILMIEWTGLAPWEFELPFPGSLASTFLAKVPILCESPKTFL